MSFGLDLDWCACGKHTQEGQLYCSLACRDREWACASSSPVVPSVTLSPSFRSQQFYGKPSHEFSLGAPAHSLSVSPTLSWSPSSYMASSTSPHPSADPKPALPGIPETPQARLGHKSLCPIERLIAPSLPLSSHKHPILVDMSHDFGLDLDWCHCGKKTFQGSLYCSARCRDLDHNDALSQSLVFQPISPSSPIVASGSSFSVSLKPTTRPNRSASGSSVGSVYSTNSMHSEPQRHLLAFGSESYSSRSSPGHPLRSTFDPSPVDYTLADYSQYRKRSHSSNLGNFSRNYALL
ncbi:uncharacterized protein BJ171DRAFT_603616 [Polychytrium aggregatum]|uniref:uncharacterized protein n=1 Tax=Polychytrium aggregatum TaxID=110093 RepID=UPI0022FF4335|nr:uncharacterized protein BJ171DRAFT_603616 [Polychytrium aggregatum]KAI9193419.1 hypothetical protein BJ171DRAFT_603616 [Polychytrium aggregatum]